MYDVHVMYQNVCMEEVSNLVIDSRDDGGSDPHPNQETAVEVLVEQQ